MFAFGKNLTDKRFPNAVQRTGATAVVGTLNDPQTYGVGVGYRF